MVRNKFFVLGDLKIRIVFPLNQWTVYFPAMNNSLSLQTFAGSLSSSVLSGVYSTSTVQCLKCFQTFALHNKDKILIISPSSVSFSLNDALSWTDEDIRGIYRRVKQTLFLVEWHDLWDETLREIYTLWNALWVTYSRRGAWMWLHWQTLSLHVTNSIILPFVPLFFLSISSSRHLLDPLALLSSIDSLPHCELKPSRRPLHQFHLIKLLETQ